MKSDYENVIPVLAEFGQFDNNSSHSTPVGLNFDRGEDIEDGKLHNRPLVNHPPNQYSPRTVASDNDSTTTNYINGFTNYKATDAAFYHRGDAETILLNDLRVADSYNGPWAVSENRYDNSCSLGTAKAMLTIRRRSEGRDCTMAPGCTPTRTSPDSAGENAYAFQVEGSSFGPTMYHAFLDTSFEDDGTYDHIAHAESDFTPDFEGHNLGQPSQWIKASMDLDGTLTSAVGGGIGYSIVPNVDFLIEDGDIQPEGWDAWLTDDILRSDADSKQG